MATQQVDQITGWGETLAYKAPVRVVTTANITLEGLQTINGVVVAANDRVGVIAQTDARENGIYIVSTGAWRRSRDFDSNRDITKGTRFAVNEGDLYTGSEWRISSANPISLGEDDITFVRADLVAQAAEQAGYAEEWAQNPEDDPVSIPAGGDGATDFSALHWAEKSKEWGEEWSQKAEDSLISTAAGGDGSTEYSAYHWSKKAEDFRDQAANYADLALNNFVVDTFTGDGTTDPLTLSGQPGSINNVFVIIEGLGPQPKAAFTLDGDQLTPSEAWPSGKGIEVSYGSSLEVAVPADLSVTRGKIAEDAVGANQIEDETINADHIDTDAAAAILAKLGITAGISFAANKNGTNQTGISTATYTKLTFTTEEWDDGGYYDAVNSRWTPPAGKYEIRVSAYITAGLVDGAEAVAAIYKNGALHRWQSDRINGTALQGISVTRQVEANGTDYFEAFIYVGGAGDKTVSGSAQSTSFQGKGI